MQPPHQHSRINLAELKAQIRQKIGLEGSKQYFDYLNGFLSLKISKVEFNKLCHRIVGREHIPLHNRFICAILKNACGAKVLPPTNDEEVLKPIRASESKEPKGDRCQQNGSLPAATHAPNAPILSNGGILPPSPRKARTGHRDRRSGDRRAAPGPNGKSNFASQQSTTTKFIDNAILENGTSTPPDNPKSVQHLQGLRQQAELEREVLGHCPAKLAVVSGHPIVPDTVRSKDQADLLIREDDKDASARSPVQAPLGIPLCSVSVGGARKVMPLSSSSSCISAVNSGCLFDTLTLRERMEQIASTQGIEGVSMDCANALNSGLDVYLQGLLRSCIELAGSRSGHDPTKNSTQKNQTHVKLINGVRLGHNYLLQSNSRHLGNIQQDNRTHCPISMQDFRVAMELNPLQLGEDWPLLLEKICTNAFEE